MAHRPTRLRGRAGLALTRAVLVAYGRTCHLCGGAGATTTDHITPLAKGGTNSLDNQRPAHHACNSARGARTLADWFAKHPHYLERLRALPPEVLAQLRPPMVSAPGPARPVLAPSRKW